MRAPLTSLTQLGCSSALEGAVAVQLVSAAIERAVAQPATAISLTKALFRKLAHSSCRCALEGTVALQLVGVAAGRGTRLQRAVTCVGDRLRVHSHATPRAGRMPWWRWRWCKQRLNGLCHSQQGGILVCAAGRECQALPGKLL